ncbi:unnamed protein product [Didymodactylos carnosus]|uniref:Uncharacterized protein n=1 Tax=Didymodactylos carnosus TaxID=1234261 RepID=A0A814BSU2_9BILA|nr:unnamed protein product [Didymodactylos carnosus]CAF3708678.1 unnamed protein product [Didymodactylos carnosus]
MPKGYEFSQEVKQLMFHIINFVEREKNGPVIPLYNVNDCLVKMLGVSGRSVRRLKQEFQQLRQKEINEQQQEETNEQQQEETEGQGEIDANVKELRSRAISLSTSKHRESSGSNPPAFLYLYFFSKFSLFLEQVMQVLLF